MQKKNIRTNIMIKYVTDVSLSVDSPNMKVSTCHWGKLIKEQTFTKTS